MLYGDLFQQLAVTISSEISPVSPEEFEGAFQDVGHGIGVPEIGFPHMKQDLFYNLIAHAGGGHGGHDCAGTGARTSYGFDPKFSKRIEEPRMGKKTKKT